MRASCSRQRCGLGILPARTNPQSLSSLSSPCWIKYKSIFHYHPSLKQNKSTGSVMDQEVKVLGLSLLWLCLQLWWGFDPWPWNLCCQCGQNKTDLLLNTFIYSYCSICLFHFRAKLLTEQFKVSPFPLPIYSLTHLVIPHLHYSTQTAFFFFFFGLFAISLGRSHGIWRFPG